jgi:hypothetical protein
MRPGSTAQDLKRWRAELKEILGVCAQRASLPVTLPHCAICARYATDNLPFEALMSLLDITPAELHSEALAAATDQLSGMPAAMRQQHVSAVTLPVLMDSPGWPLVRSLVIDMANQAVHEYFDDPRLSDIEEITLLGFAYGGCEVKPAFSEALFNSRSFVNIRSLTFHSTESGADMSQRFWSSPLARRLERIDGVPYFGDPVIGPLGMREISLASYFNIPDRYSLSPLLDPAATPRLTNLTLRAYFDALPRFLQVLAAEGGMLERIDNVSLGLSDFHGEHTQLIRPATLPASTRAVCWYSDYRHVSRINSGCDVHTLYDFADENVDIRLGDKATDYNGLIFDWRLRDNISRRVEDLSMLLPLEIDIGEVVEFCTEFRRLKKLSLVYPFTEAELETLLKSDQIRQFEALTLILCVNGGQWESGGVDAGRSNEYMKANESRYRSDVSAKYLFDLAFGDWTASIHNLSITTLSFAMTRSPERVQHCDLRTAVAAQAFAEHDSRLPIEVLCFDSDLSIDEVLATALAGSGVLGRVYRLNLFARLDAAAARILAGCEQLRTVRFFSHSCWKNPPDAIQALIHSAHLTGAWDVTLSLPGSRNVPGIEAMCAESPLLDHAVALGLDGPEQSTLIPSSGRLGRVRRLDESLTMRVLGDARLATVWCDHPVGRPLRARLVDLIERTYRVNQPLEDLPDLEQKLATLSPDQDEDGFVRALRAVLATAFSGNPAAEGTPFAELSESQQSALRAVAQLDGDWWNIGGLMHYVMTSYGFPFWDRERLKEYIAGSVVGIN